MIHIILCALGAYFALYALSLVATACAPVRQKPAAALPPQHTPKVNCYGQPI